MKKALLYFTGFSAHVGGSEPLVFSLMHELQRSGYHVTLALQSGGDFKGISAAYGCDVDLDAVSVVYLSKASGLWAKIDRKLHLLWRRRLRRLGTKFDVCISCANPVDFGRPGIHFVHMMTLDASYFNKVWYHDQHRCVPMKVRLAQWADAFGRILSGARSAWQLVRDAREVVLPNSNFVKQSIEAYYKCRVHDAFYPPTLFEPIPAGGTPVAPGVIDVACIGRVGPEKKVLEIIDIVEWVRRLTGKELRLRIAGHVPADNATYTDYGRRVRAKAAECPWVQLEGVLTGEAKVKYLAECRLAIHHCEVEAFGISVTEYIKAGIVPIVPRAGGSSEVVGIDELVFSSDDESVCKLKRLIEDPKFYDACLTRVKTRAEEFSAQKYLARQRDLLTELGILNRQNLV